MNEEIFISLVETTPKGGLFDIGATLPLVAVQFLGLMFLLNIILYNPLIQTINERNDYIFNNLTKASNMLFEASELTMQYENDLSNAKKNAQLEIAKAQKMQKESFLAELETSQTYIDSLVEKVLINFLEKKETILNNLAPEIDSLSNKMLNALFMKKA